MEITEHQANMLRALADGKTLQACQVEPLDGLPLNGTWFNIEELNNALLFLTSKNYCVRIKPDVIVVNGIEVPAPEREKLAISATYYVPSLAAEYLALAYEWCGAARDQTNLDRGIIHANRDNAVAHAKAMLAHKPG